MVIQKSLLVIDLDGTLLNSREEIGNRDLKVLRAYIKQGGRLVLASGRSFRLLSKYVGQLGLSSNDLVICRDGQYVHKGNGEVMFSEPLLSGKDYSFIINLFPSIRIDAYSENTDYTYVQNANLYYKLKFHTLMDTRRRIVRNNRDVQLEFEKIKIFINSMPIKTFELLNSMYSVKKIRGNSYEINHKGVSKYSALQNVLKLDDYKDLEILYFGDDNNDLECFQNISCSIAMENASKEILDIASLFTKSNDSNGVSYFIENVGWFDELSIN